MANETPKLYIDGVSAFAGGVDSGQASELIDKNQLSFAINASLRGSYIKNRPPYQLKVLNYNGNSALHTLVETGLFQGAEIYRPDYGTSFIVAVISGHILTLTETSGVWTVLDVSISGDLMSATAPQIWMDQSEKWMIISDGSGALPVFFDGVSCRRSVGDTVVLAVASAAAPTSPPPIGQPVILTVGSFSGTYGVPVLFNGEYYQTTQNSSTPTSFSAIVTNLTDTAATEPIGTNVVVNPNVLGITNNSGGENLASGQFLPAGFVQTQVILRSPPPSGIFHVNQLIGVGNQTVKITQISNSILIVTNPVQWNGPFMWSFSNGQPVQSTTGGNSYIVGQISISDLSVPAIGSTEGIQLTNQFTGTNNLVVRIGSGYYSIVNTYAPPSGDTTSLTLINLTDNSAAVYVFPTDGLPVNSVPELPALVMGAYGMGRNWYSLVGGTSYIAGDIVGSASGSVAYNYRDSVLKTVENTFLFGSGSFHLPGSGEQITAIFFPAVLDTSLGQGACMVSTAFSIYSNSALPDRSQWPSQSFPIQSESLKDKGALGQWSTVSVNSDIFFRSYDGLGSLILARREFYDWGNKVISNEMLRTLSQDDPALLQYGSGISFDNRDLHTASPQFSTAGTINRQLTALNFDLISSLRKTIPPSWEGGWTGLNVLKLLRGTINNVGRAFAFTFNISSSKIQLYEFLPERTSEYLDNGTTPIGWFFETANLFGDDVKPLNELIQLRDGEVYLSSIRGDVHVKVFYRPDYYPCWELWNEFDVSSDPTKEKGYRMRIGLGEPSPEPVEIGNNRPLRCGYLFQFRIEIVGACQFMGARFSASHMSQPSFAPIQYEDALQMISCNTISDNDFYQLQGS